MKKSKLAKAYSTFCIETQEKQLFAVLRFTFTKGKDVLKDFFVTQKKAWEDIEVEYPKADVWVVDSQIDEQMANYLDGFLERMGAKPLPSNELVYVCSLDFSDYLSPKAEQCSA